MRAIIRDELHTQLSKALTLPAGATAAPVTTQQYLNALAQRGLPSRGANPLGRDLTPSAFGPGIPLLSAPIDPALPATGRPAPRRYEYAVSENLNLSARHVPFSTLRDTADAVSLIRNCIEVRKSTITGLDWGFAIDPTRVSHLADTTNTSRHTVESDLHTKYATDIARLHGFWSTPDRINGWTFSEWIAAIIEEQLVVDAIAIYPHMAMSGQLHSFELLDGASIKPILDHRGAQPQPPNVAFQQILFGFPRGEFTASPLDDVDAQFISAVYGRQNGTAGPTDSLIYKARHRRTNSPYGLPNVEQALSNADLWLKRIDWLRSEYAAGVTPEMIIQVDASMTPEQLRQYEAVWNDELSGRTMERHRARFLPAGFTADYPPGLDQKFSNDLDLHLVRLLCADFDVLPTSIGFTPNHGMGGMGGQGHGQSEDDDEMRRGTKPTAAWLTDIINDLSRRWLGMPDEVTFQFHGLDDKDEELESKLLIGYVQAGLKTANEGRDQLNLPRYQFPLADQPFIATGGAGPKFLDPAVQPPYPNEPGGGVPSGGGGPAPSESEEQEVASVAAQRDTVRRHTPAPISPTPPPPANKPSTAPTAQGVLARAAVASRRREHRQFLAYATNPQRRPEDWEDFAFTSLPDDVGEALNALGKVGDVDAAKALLAMHDA